MFVTAAVADLRLSHRPQLGRSPAVDRSRRTAWLFNRSLAELGDRFSIRGGHMVGAHWTKSSGLLWRTSWRIDRLDGMDVRPNRIVDWCTLSAHT